MYVFVSAGFFLLGVPLVDLVGKPCVNLDSSIQLQSLLNLAIYKLSVDPQDSVGLRLLLSGISSDQGYWQDPRRRQSDWDGGVCINSSSGTIRLWGYSSKSRLDWGCRPSCWH